jgi:uncharacterized Tic20 family protein
MNCPNCGTQLLENAQFCQNCGCSGNPNIQQPNYTQTAGKEPDGKSIGCNILSFFMPIVGLILWLIWKDEYPIKAKGCGKSALLSVILCVVFYILSFVLLMAIAALGSAALTETGYEIADSAVALCAML